MAKGDIGSPDNSYASPTNPNGRQRIAAQQASSSMPFQGGLQSSFTNNINPIGVSGAGIPQIHGGTHASSVYVDPNNKDPDVANAANVYAELTNPNAGSSHDDLQSRYNMYTGRIGIKNSLADQIASNPDQLAQTESNLKLQAGQALGQGLKETRQNYSKRGLLYSGLRENAETEERGAVGSALSSGLSGAKRESENSLSAAQNAYASVDLANQQESLQLANQAFDTASMNNIARLQAMQQLGHGLGSLAGSIAGGDFNKKKTDDDSPNTVSTGRTQTLSPEIGY